MPRSPYQVNDGAELESRFRESNFARTRSRFVAPVILLRDKVGGEYVCVCVCVSVCVCMCVCVSVRKRERESE